jgi:hypothetical protein
MTLTIVEDSKDNFLFHFTPEHLIDKMLVELFKEQRAIQIDEKHHFYIENQVGKKVTWTTFIECMEDCDFALPIAYPEIKVNDYTKWNDLAGNMVYTEPLNTPSSYRVMTDDEVYIILVNSMLQSKQNEDSKFLFLMRFLRQEDDSEDDHWLQRWAVDIIEKKKGVIGIKV